jgi:flagellar basal-body rod protein FlgC
MFNSLDISSSALTAQRVRMDTIAGNIANMNTTHDANGKANPYRRKFAVFAEGNGDHPGEAGVHIEQIREDAAAFRKVYEPGHVDADQDGNVLYPNMDLSIEMVNAMEASRAYEANVTTMEVTKSMMNATLRLIA